jgi:hypothetical protein
MECFILLFLTVIPLLPGIFGKNYSGQKKVVNKFLETYLWCFAADKKHQWFQWLPIPEWWYNTSYRTGTHMNPFE